jgi:hypothetical protein
MTKVDRYDFRSKHHGTEVVVKSREGKWVKAADYDALTAERDAVHKAWKQAVLEFDKKCKEANKHNARAEAAEADSKRLREALTVASQALDDAGDELNELADTLSREPHAAFSAYRSARIAAALTGKQTK